MMKSKICLTILLLCSMITFAQTAKKPTIMVIPSDHWCSTRYFTTVIENQGKKVTVNDYEAAFREDAELFLAILPLPRGTRTIWRHLGQSK